MLQSQRSMVLSPYMDIYDLVIPSDHLLRKINDLVDFSFIYKELVNNYCPDNGRNAIDPIRMFKYLLLKVIDTLSDIDVVERSRYDMSYKYFLGMAPEEDIIDPSSLTKFRKLRLKDSTLLDMLIGKTVQIAIEKGIIKSKTIIIDSTHTKARYNQKSNVEVLREFSKRLRKVVYAIDESMRDRFPAKLTGEDIEKEIIYCQELIGVINQNPVLKEYPTVREKINLLNETITDDLAHLQAIPDSDARVGHKTAESSFFGYKTHLAMSEERIITAAVVTSGEKNDGKQLPALVEKSKASGMVVEAVVGDMAYSEKGNIEYSKENDFHLVSKLNPIITDGARKKEAYFDFNKDAGLYVCKAGHMAIRKAVQGKRSVGKNQTTTYYFDIGKCGNCSMAQGCYLTGSKSKTYSVTIKSESHSTHIKFQESEYFREKAKERYKIEAKNSELKNRHGYDTAVAAGLGNMELQGALSIFAVNLKRIIKLMK